MLTSHRAKGTEFAKGILTDVGYRSPNENAALRPTTPAIEPTPNSAPALSTTSRQPEPATNS